MTILSGFNDLKVKIWLRNIHSEDISCPCTKGHLPKYFSSLRTAHIRGMKTRFLSKKNSSSYPSREFVRTTTRRQQNLFFRQWPNPRLWAHHSWALPTEPPVRGDERRLESFLICPRLRIHSKRKDAFMISSKMDGATRKIIFLCTNHTTTPQKSSVLDKSELVASTVRLRKVTSRPWSWWKIRSVEPKSCVCPCKWRSHSIKYVSW